MSNVRLLTNATLLLLVGFTCTGGDEALPGPASIDSRWLAMPSKESRIPIESIHHPPVVEADEFVRLESAHRHRLVLPGGVEARRRNDYRVRLPNLPVSEHSMTTFVRVRADASLLVFHSSSSGRKTTRQGRGSLLVEIPRAFVVSDVLYVAARCSDGKAPSDLVIDVVSFPEKTAETRN